VHVRLDEADGAVRQELQRIAGHIVALARGEADRQLPRQPRIAGAVMRHDRLLEEGIAEIGEQAPDRKASSTS